MMWRGIVTLFSSTSGSITQVEVDVVAIVLIVTVNLVIAISILITFLRLYLRGRFGPDFSDCCRLGCSVIFGVTGFDVRHMHEVERQDEEDKMKKTR